MMNQDDLATYLRLSPEFGGTRFGPFEGIEILLGSDSDRCDITVPESLGVDAVHVKLLLQVDGSMILAPVEMTASVFLLKQGARRAVQLSSPTAVLAGDSFSLVTEDGPRFLIEVDELPPEIKKKRQKARSIRGRRLSAGSLAAEGKRQIWTRILVTGPGRMLQRASTFIRSGAIFQPRYIFLGIAIAGGYIWGGSMTCSSRKKTAMLQASSSRLTNCKKDLSFAESMGSDARTGFPQLVADITGSPQLGRALEEDDSLRGAVKAAAKNVLNQAHAYDWLIEGGDRRSGDFATWREMLLDEEALDADLVQVAPYIGVEPNMNRSQWSRTEDSRADDVCTRGQSRITFRQGLHLGLLVQGDALVSGDLDLYRSNKTRREDVLMATFQKSGVTEFPDTFETIVEPFGRGRHACVYIDGQDDRLDSRRLLAAMVRQLGEDSPGLPTVDSAHSVVARIARFHSADLPDVDLRQRNVDLDFSEFPVGTVLSGMDSKGRWVLQRTAATLARAMVIPCEATLRNPGPEAESIFGELPDVVPCLVLDYKLRNE